MKRQPKGVRTGGQFATDARNDDIDELDIETVSADDAIAGIGHELTGAARIAVGDDPQPEVPDFMAEQVDNRHNPDRHDFNPTDADGFHHPLLSDPVDYMDQQTDWMARLIRASRRGPFISRSDLRYLPDERVDDISEKAHRLASADGVTETDIEFYANRWARELDQWDARPRPKIADDYVPIGHGHDHADDNAYYPDRRGSRYDGEFHTSSDIAKGVRAEIKNAVKAGHLPDLDYRVSSDRFSGGQAVDVRVEGLADSWLNPTDGNEGPRRRYLSSQADELYDRVDTIRNAWNRDRSNTMVDYFDVQYYGSVRLADERDTTWSRNEREKARQRRQQKGK